MPKKVTTAKNTKLKEVEEVECPECYNIQGDMGNNVKCEECGFGPMPTADKKLELKAGDSALVKKGTKAYDLPIISTFNRADMDRAKDLLEEYTAIQPLLKQYEERKKEIANELAELAKKHKVPGMRWGNWVMYFGGEIAKKTLDAALLLEHKVKQSVIDQCYKESNPYYDVRVFDLERKKEED